MNSIYDLLSKNIESDKFISLVISNNKTRNKLTYNKVDVKPILMRNELHYQLSFYYDSKVEHKNFLPDQALEEIMNIFDSGFRQGMFFTSHADYQILISKKSKVKIVKTKASKELKSLSHNKTKNYIIEEDRPCDFLIKLGVMSRDGRVYRNKYDQFRQINRFLELVDDVIDELDRSKSLNIVDFGCGKSYLTFALYYYLVEIKNLDANIIGLDLKEDVINFCNQVSSDLAYNNLKFIHGDINDFDQDEKIDMMVTLHACDTATDAALVKAINWDVDIILSVPCCQKEIRKSIDNQVLSPMLDHGIIKEKLSTLVTDTLRAMVLENLGYDVQLLEFIDIENTPKNTLIRAINKHRKPCEMDIKNYLAFKNFWHLGDLFIEGELEKINRNFI